MVNHDSNNGHCPGPLLFSFLINPLGFVEFIFQTSDIMRFYQRKKSLNREQIAVASLFG